MSTTRRAPPTTTTDHHFHTVAFAENFALKDVAAEIPEARKSPLELQRALGHGEQFVFPFGVVVFREVAAAEREAELARLGRPRTLTPVAQDGLVVREDPGGVLALEHGVLVVDRLTPARSGVVALTLAQSAAMEYYERIVEEMFANTDAWVDRLEKSGTVPLRIRPLHRFIGAAVGTRSEALAVLHLLDKPDATWDDPALDAIYDELRDEFDLSDRFAALEHKLRSVQEALELLLDVARDRRLVLLEGTIVVLIVIEIVMGLLKRA